ncbi:MAG: hypothetical protein AAB316_09515, partial [Bacteroidota bacterium]
MTDFYKNIAEIEDLVANFRNLTLPAASWTHEAHLTTGLWFLKNHDQWAATCFLRSGIITYNHSVGGKNTPEGGYHETMTLFWINVLAQFVKQNQHLGLLDLCNAFLASELASKEMPMRFYSKKVLFSAQARAVWVEPDLLPQIAVS